jgi:hypothetical protein
MAAETSIPAAQRGYGCVAQQIVDAKCRHESLAAVGAEICDVRFTPDCVAKLGTIFSVGLSVDF